MTKIKYTEFPKINPVCKYVCWIVETSKTSTTNPMTKCAALKLIKERREKALYAELIKTWSCVQAKNLMKIN